MGVDQTEPTMPDAERLRHYLNGELTVTERTWLETRLSREYDLQDLLRQLLDSPERWEISCVRRARALLVVQEARLELEDPEPPGSGPRLDLLQAMQVRTDAAVMRFCNSLVVRALGEGYEIVEVRPEPDGVGVYAHSPETETELERYPTTWLAPLVVRLKTLAEVDPQVVDRPQHGRIRLAWQGSRFAIETTFEPSPVGERVTMVFGAD